MSMVCLSSFNCFFVYNSGFILMLKASSTVFKSPVSTLLNLYKPLVYKSKSIKILKNLMNRCYKYYDTAVQRINNNIKKYETSINKLNQIKITALRNLFTMSSILLLYGVAGTGKTTLMKYISDFYEGDNQLFITKTHAALENLRCKISKRSKRT